jgi:arylsulfatase A-like enzyme
MFTGLYTHQNGLMGLCHRGWEFSPGTVHLAQRLRDGGYANHLFGLQHETHGAPERLGYQNHHSAEDRHAPAVCASLAEWLRGDDAKRSPWFAHAGFSHVHRPFPERTRFDPATVQVPPYLPDTEAVRRDYAHFYESIAEMDAGVGEALSALRESGLEGDTIVVFTTDHGSPFPRAKSTYFDPGTRIPLIMRGPGLAADGGQYGQLLSNLDFTPTLLDLAGIPVPDGLEGRSFAALLAGEPYVERDAVYGALYYDAYYDPMHCVRTRRHKYIRSFAVSPEEAAGADPEALAKHETGEWIRADDSDVQRSATWQIMKGDKHRIPPPEELYDLVEDPLEQTNLLAATLTPEIEAVAQRMRGLLRDMMHRTGSPLLSGHVSPELSATRNKRYGEV